MNIYVRYFDQDTLVYNLDELINFLSSIPDIRITPELVNDLREYINSDMPYPKRYKVRPRVYFILIKTTADSLAAFKANRKTNVPGAPQQQRPEPRQEQPFVKKDSRVNQLTDSRQGWYKGTIMFKRVIQIPGTSKFQYQDTVFSACVLTDSGVSCYNRIVDHLKARKDVDPRSQFPSAKGQNFQFIYMGETLPPELLEVAKENQQTENPGADPTASVADSVTPAEGTATVSTTAATPAPVSPAPALQPASAKPVLAKPVARSRRIK